MATSARHSLPRAELYYTILLNGRTPDRPRLTPAEAEAMLVAGFRFSIFDPGQGEFNVSMPYAVSWSMDQDTVTFMQVG